MSGSALAFNLFLMFLNIGKKSMSNATAMKVTEMGLLNMEVFEIKALVRFSSAMGPKTKPMTSGAKGMFLLSRRNPSNPNPSITQMSNTRLLRAKEPMMQNARMIGIR